MKEMDKPIFEVFKDGERLMWTADPKCVPSQEMVASLKRAGHRVKVRKDGGNEPKA